MKKRIFSAMVVTLFAISCNQDEGLKQVVNTPKSGITSEVVEFFDGATEKAYRFSFSDVYTPYVTYTYEVLDGEDAPTEEKAVLLLEPEDYQILPSVSQSDISFRFLKQVYLINPKAPDSPVSLAPGTDLIVSCTCKSDDSEGSCFISHFYNNQEQNSVTVTCDQGTCKKKCKIGARQAASIISGSIIVYAK